MEERKKNIRILELMTGSILSAGIILGAIYFLTKQYEFKIPDRIVKRLEEKKVYIRQAEFETRIFPYPHIYSRFVEIKFHKYVVVKIDHLRITPDIWSMLVKSEQKIARISVEKASLRVLHVYPQGSAGSSHTFQKIDLDNLLEFIKTLMNVITEKLPLPETIEISLFNLFVDIVDPENELVIVRNFIGQNHNQFIKMRGDTEMGNWMKARADISLWLRPEKKKEKVLAIKKDSIIERVDIYADGKFDLEKLPDQFIGMPPIISGKLSSHHYVTFTLPVQKLFHTHNVSIEELTLNEGEKPFRKFLNFSKEQKVQYTASGISDEKSIRTNSGKLIVDSKEYNLDFQWIYKKYFLEFIGNSQVPFSQARKILGNALGPNVIHLLNTSNGKIDFNYFNWNPWKNTFQYSLGFVYKPVKIISGFPNNKNLWVSGKMNGNGITTVFPRLRLYSDNTSITANGSQLSNSSFFVHASPKGTLYLGDIIPDTDGSIEVDGSLHCYMQRELWCRPSTVNISGKKIYLSDLSSAFIFQKFLPGTSMLINGLRNEKAIAINEIKITSALREDRLLFYPSTIKSNLGYFDLSGSYSLGSKNGKMKVELLPAQKSGFSGQAFSLVGGEKSLAQKAVFLLGIRSGKVQLDSLSFKSVSSSSNSTIRDK